MKIPRTPWMPTLACALVVCFSGLMGGSQAVLKDSNVLVGVKIYEYSRDLTKLFAQWKKMGINTAFIGTGLASNREFMDLARKERIRTFVILPIFYNAEKLKENPSLYAITAAGKRAEKEWVQFVCPSRSDYRAERLELVREILRSSSPDGLSIDFIRYFVFWEKISPEMQLDPMENSCFCPVCIQKFRDAMHVTVPAQLTSTAEKSEWIIKNHPKEWNEFKCQNITTMIRDIAREARRIKRGILLNIHLVPWREKDFDRGIRRVVGQDVAALAQWVDYLSPMCYAHMVEQTPAWIHSVAEDIARRGKKPVLPSIQVAEAYRKEKVSAEEFRKYLQEAVKPPSKGVIFWNWNALESDAEKSAIVAGLFSSTGDKR